MKIKFVLVLVLLLMVILGTASNLKAATSLAPPTVSNLPTHWKQTDEQAYPFAPSEHDPVGAGKLEYTDTTTYDYISIWYEQAQVTSYTNTQLQSEAERLFNDYDSSLPLDSGGIKTYAGFTAGYARGYNGTTGLYGVYKEELVFLIGSYYINIHAYYDVTTQSENNIDTIVNSIEVATPTPTVVIQTPTPTSQTPTLRSENSFSWIYVVVGLVAIIIVCIVVIVVVATRKRAAQQQATTNTAWPTPPPPPTSN